MLSVWCTRLVGADGVRNGVRFTVTDEGMVARVDHGVSAAGGDLVVGTVVPGFADAHSHAFHRVMRGRTHGDGGDFWRWREQMYRAAAQLTPENYHDLARAVFAEMVCAGYTAVGEFHYVHHRPDGAPYPHEMERALDAAAQSVGIRLTLLDTAYLSGGIGQELGTEQRRFSDVSAERYLERWHSLQGRVAHLGAAIHSVRAVPLDAIERIAAGLPADVPLHIHLSEQPQENIDAIAAFGRTPTELFAERGLLAERLSVVHATHLTERDIGLLGSGRVTVVMCPSTEADLGDGIGPASELQAAGARLALGSDQNAVIDPLAELRSLEMHERLRTGLRGRFAAGELLRTASAQGYHSLGLPAAPLAVGGPCDLVEIDPQSVRTAGSEPAQLMFSATAADVQRVVVGGRVVAAHGVLASGERPAPLVRRALGAFS